MDGTQRIPSGLEYGRISPEAIPAKVKYAFFESTNSQQYIKNNETIRFLLANDGFLDPYSMYIKLTVQVEDLEDGEVRFLDRSAHSLFSKITLKSNGQEIERLDNYDTMVAIINDATYNADKIIQHTWEGHPKKNTQPPRVYKEPYEKMMDIMGMYYPGGHETQLSGETAFFNGFTQTEVTELSSTVATDLARRSVATSAIFEPFTGTQWPRVLGNNTLTYTDTTRFTEARVVEAKATDAEHHRLLGHVQGECYDVFDGVYDSATTRDDGQYNIDLKTFGTTQRTFILPIYSGVIGLLMPQKKFIPLEYLPLDLEFTLNPYALYSSSKTGSRAYKVTNAALYANILFFNEDLHRSINTSIAHYGLFMHCNSFQAPTTIGFNSGTTSIPMSLSIPATHRSINSMHIVFQYGGFENNPCQRKLHFVSHLLSQLQIKNGMDYNPDQPIQSFDYQQTAGDTFSTGHHSFFLSTMKSWNKLHDMQMDTLINDLNWGKDILGIQEEPIYTLQDVFNGGILTDPYGLYQENTLLSKVLQETWMKQALVGRTQYGISFEGEEFGEKKSLITGKQAQIPFEVQMRGTKSLADKTSQAYVFIKYDFILRLEQDLSLTISGK